MTLLNDQTNRTDVETIQITRTIGEEISSTYEWSKFSASMYSLESTTGIEGNLQN